MKRQIFDNLYNLKYRSDPEKWKNADYIKYCEETIWAEIPEYDPNFIELDDFTKKIQVDFYGN